MEQFITAAEAKAALRQQVREEMASMTPEELLISDQAMFDVFLNLRRVERAKTILLFWGIPGREPGTGHLVRALAERGKRVGLPRMLPEHQMEVRLYQPDRPLVPAAFGILEPPEDAPLLPREEIQLALVPALCYDRKGYRLGFGGGYYDRWLAEFFGFTVGLCRDRVLQSAVPREEHDRRINLIITETEQFF